MSNAVKALEAAVIHLITAARSWLLLGIAISLSAGLTGWALVHGEALEGIVSNELTVEQRGQLMVTLVVTLAIVAGLSELVRRRGESVAPLEQHMRRFNELLLPVLLGPVLVQLSAEGVEVQDRVGMIVLVALTAAVLASWIYREGWLRARLASIELSDRFWVRATVVLGFVYALGFTYLSIVDHLNLGTHHLDLAIYDNVVWHTSQGNFLGCSLCREGVHYSGHFDPILALVALPYRSVPRAETLLVFQSVWLALGVAPAFSIARRRLGSAAAGFALALVYTLHPALHGANLYDFHSLTLVTPTFLWLVHLVDRGSRVGYGALLLLMLATREDLALLAAFIGLYACLRRRVFLGLATIVLSLLYFTVVKAHVMPASGIMAVDHFVGRYQDMIPHRDENLMGLVISVITNPVFAFRTLLHPDKLFYYLAMLLPMGFLPLMSGRKLVLAIYGLVFIGLANLEYHYSFHFQYSVLLFPALLVGLPDGLGRALRSGWAKRSGLDRAGLVAAAWTFVLVASVLVSVKLGATASNRSFRAGWNQMTRVHAGDDLKRHDVLRGMIDRIPVDATVCATNTLSPHVSNRAKVSVWPRCGDSEYYLLYSGPMSRKQKQQAKRVRLKPPKTVLDREMGIEMWHAVPPEKPPGK